MEMFILSTQNIRFDEKFSEHCNCIASFLAEVCFVCAKEASHRGVSFEHIDNAFLWKIMKSYRP